VSGRTRADIALVAVVGDVEIELFDAFLEHYAALGVDELALGFVRGRASEAGGKQEQLVTDSFTQPAQVWGICSRRSASMRSEIGVAWP
jgi:hypothetical protein